MLENLWKLFVSFLKVGTFGFGGGQAAIPLIETEVVDLNGWLTPDQFSDYLTMGNTLPGPIATKMSIIIGYDLFGFAGAMVALLGMLLPSSIAIILLFNVFMQYRESPVVIGMQAAAKPVVVALIAGVAYGMGRAAYGKLDGFVSMNSLIIIGIFVASVTLVLLAEYKIFSVHPAFIVVGALLIGGIFIR